MLLTNLTTFTNLGCRMYYYGDQIRDFLVHTSAINIYGYPSILFRPVPYPPAIGWLTCLFGIMSLILAPALGLGLTKIYLNLSKGKNPSVNHVFSGMSQLWEAFVINIVMCVFIFLWSLLLIIPGIVKAFSYSMSYYILAENPGMSGLESLKQSQKMMKGYKFEYFILHLSFFWWHILGTITMGLGYIYITPYISATCANFYNKIKNEQKLAQPDSDIAD